MRLKIASRKSDLARWQAVTVGRALESLPEKPEIEYLFKASLGDQNLDLPLASMGKGVFTEDFYQDLTGGECDLVVHSWKDLPVEERPDTRIAFTLERADVRDILLIPESVWRKAVQEKRLTVFTSSPRRIYNLQESLGELLPAKMEIKFEPVRGNVPTRVRKMREQETALVLAKAGLDRLIEAERNGFCDNGLIEAVKECRFQILPISLNPPAPAQGALAVEVSARREDLLQLGRKLNSDSAYAAVRREREVLSSYGGGCHQKIGVAVLHRTFGTVFALKGLTDDGRVLNDFRIENDTPWSRATSEDRVFPITAASNSWFERVPLTIDPNTLNGKDLFVARADAWPDGFAPKEGSRIWTAGVKTWRKLARKGIWVNGTTDSLGEDDKPYLSWLEDVRWCKLTHSQAAGPNDVATYELKPGSDHPNLSGKTHFFWLSGTSFERARELFPREISEGRHSCGPGNTYRHLANVKGLKYPVKVFWNLEQFWRETRPC